MPAHEKPRILLCADSAAQSGELSRLLYQAECFVHEHPLGATQPGNIASYHVAVVNANGNASRCASMLQKLRQASQEGYLPTLLIINNHSVSARKSGLESGADAYVLRPFDPVELLTQIRILLRNKDRHDRLAEKTAEVHHINKRLQEAYQQIDGELELARRIQESFLPRRLPEVPEVKFAVHYQPCKRVGGDFYDVMRLDEQHVGLYVADAMGHGVPASLLTIFVKTSVRAKEVTGNRYRLISPDEVLGRLNRDLIQQQLSDTPFITMVYVLYNHRERTLSFSRSGHPYPLYIPKDGEPELWSSEGSLLGVFETRYALRTHQLKPGDKVLLYTDGIDAARYDCRANGLQSLLAYAGDCRHVPIEELIRQLPLEIFKTTRPTDDLTVVGLEVSDDSLAT
jgi:sigma-B regulation protein RsbU (phosphoserine phosphatase)